MAIPINIEDLLNKRKIESNRIDLKRAGILIESIGQSVLLLIDFDNICQKSEQPLFLQSKTNCARMVLSLRGLKQMKTEHIF